MSCEHLKVVTVSAGKYAISADSRSRPCRYTVRWCPKEGDGVTLIENARVEKAIRSVREHRMLGDTIEHLMAFPLH